MVCEEIKKNKQNINKQTWININKQNIYIGVNTLLGYCKTSELLGEISYLSRSREMVSVIADEDVTVFELERNYLETTMQENPSFAGKFFKFLGWVLARRVRLKEESEQEALQWWVEDRDRDREKKKEREREREREERERWN